MPKLDLSQIPVKTSSSYPAPYDAQVSGRRQQKLGDAAGLSQFGVNLVRLAPGAMSSLRHWHERQDEFVMVTEGTLTLVEDQGETVLTAGDCAGFPAGDPNGHHLVNKSDAEAAFLVMGTRTEQETGWYPDIDMKVEISRGEMRYTRRNGAPLDGDTAPIADNEPFADLSERLTRSLLDGDADIYRSVFHLPVAMYPRNGNGYTLTTEDAVRKDFDLYREAIVEQGLTRIERKVLRTSQPEDDARVVEAEVRLFRDDTLIVEPFVTTFRLERQGGEWRIARIISSLGHINWTLGRSGITRDMKFELD